ncbi:MAG: hypothetical protein ACO38W_12925, partial [Phycisphaerales bacterium]
ERGGGGEIDSTGSPRPRPRAGGVGVVARALRVSGARPPAIEREANTLVCRRGWSAIADSKRRLARLMEDPDAVRAIARAPAAVEPNWGER